MIIIVVTTSKLALRTGKYVFCNNVYKTYTSIIRNNFSNITFLMPIIRISTPNPYVYYTYISAEKPAKMLPNSGTKQIAMEMSVFFTLCQTFQIFTMMWPHSMHWHTAAEWDTNLCRLGDIMAWHHSLTPNGDMHHGMTSHGDIWW